MNVNVSPFAQASNQLNQFFDKNQNVRFKAKISLELSGVLDTVNSISNTIDSAKQQNRNIDNTDIVLLKGIQNKITKIKDAKLIVGREGSLNVLDDCLAKIKALQDGGNTGLPASATAAPASATAPATAKKQQYLKEANRLIDSLLTQDLGIEGIFRAPVEKTEIDAYKAKLDQNIMPDKPGPELAAGLIKDFFRGMNPLGTKLIKINVNDKEAINQFKQLVKELPKDEKEALGKLMQLLHKVSDDQQKSKLKKEVKLTEDTLATSIGGSLCNPPEITSKNPLEATREAAQIMESNNKKIAFMIKNYEAIFSADEKAVAKDDLKPDQPVTVSPSNIQTGTVGAPKEAKEPTMKERGILVNRLCDFLIKNEGIQPYWQGASNAEVTKEVEKKLLERKEKSPLKSHEISEIGVYPGVIRDVLLSNLGKAGVDYQDLGNVLSIKTSISKLLLSSDDILQSIAAVGKANPTLMKEILEGAELGNIEILKDFDNLEQMEDVENRAEIQKTIRDSLTKSYGSI